MDPRSLSELTTDSVTDADSRIDAAVLPSSERSVSVTSRGDLAMGSSARGPGLGLAAAVGFQDQRNKRTRRLTKIEREAAVGDLEISMKPAAARVFPGLSETASLRSLRRSARVLAVLCPDETSFTAFTDECRALRRRLKLSSTIVLGVRGDGATDQDASFVPRRGSDLLKTFGELLNEDASWGDFEFQEKKAAWFALSYAGRSVGSGTGAPDFLELLGSLLPPRDFVEPLPPLQGGTGPLDAQKAFYDALTSGDLAAMRSVLSESMAPRVSAALEAGAPARSNARFSTPSLAAVSQPSGCPDSVIATCARCTPLPKSRSSST